MPYEFFPKTLYRMPTHFGPSLGPRQGLDGRRYACVEGPRQRIFAADFRANAAELEKFLPRQFSLRDALLRISFAVITEIEWLAGRGYNTFGVSIPAAFHGERDDVEGDLLLVLWENMADPIITGREDLGFSKVYCELPAPITVGDSTTCRASWDGCEFAKLSLSGRGSLTEPAASSKPSDGLLHLKYMPATGETGETDACYPVMTPAAAPNLKTEAYREFENAKLEFRMSTWEELPTLVHIVNALAALDIGECVAASVSDVCGYKDLSDQRRLV